MMKCDSVAAAVGLEGREDDVYCVAQQQGVKPRRLNLGLVGPKSFPAILPTNAASPKDPP